MNHEKLKDFYEINAIIGNCVAGLLKAQELLVELMCNNCDIPTEMKDTLITDMNQLIGIKKL